MLSLHARKKSPPVPPITLREYYFSQDNQAFLLSGQVDFNKMMAGINLPINSHILEIGCCTGRVLRNFWPVLKKYRVDGCDIEPAYVQWCREHMNPMRFYFPEEIPLNTYDFVYCQSVFTHIPNPIPDLFKIRKFLKKDGLFYVTIHDEVDLERIKGFPEKEQLRRFIEDYVNLNEFHVSTIYSIALEQGRNCKVFYNRDFFVKLASYAGFKLIKIVDKAHRNGTTQTGLLFRTYLQQKSEVCIIFKKSVI